VTRTIVTRGDVQIEVLAQGQGHSDRAVASLGRGASDFDAIAERLAAASFRVLRPQAARHRASRGPMTGIDLHTYAADIAAVIEQDGSGPAFVVGHAFGNRVARMLAVDRHWRRPATPPALDQAIDRQHARHAMPKAWPTTNAGPLPSCSITAAMSAA